MISLLAQQLLPEPLRAMRDQFRQGGSFGGLFLALLLLGALLGFAYLAGEMQRRKRTGGTRRVTPERLFDDLLSGLRLSKEEQAFLASACREAKIAHPASLLIAEKLFDEAMRKAANPTFSTDQITALRNRLFPSLHGPGVVTSSTNAQREAEVEDRPWRAGARERNQ